VVRVLKDALQTHPERDVTLDDLAHHNQLNKHYLLKVFKRDVAISPHVFQTCLRIKKVMALLHQGVPIAQVAADTGFVDQSHLHHTFKKYVLVTPGQYQQTSFIQGSARGFGLTTTS
jgi:AraC-like DNA-binding protein